MSVIIDGSGNSVSLDAVAKVSGGTQVELQTGGTTKVTVDAAGNAGLGVVPSAWGTFKSIQVNHGAVSSTAVGQHNVSVSANAYFDGTNWRYIGSSLATEFRQNGGGFQWLTAPSGTAGQPISFTQELALTQRYFEKSYEQGVNPGTVTSVGSFLGVASAGGLAYSTVPYKVVKRAIPSVTAFSPDTGTVSQYRDIGAGVDRPFALGGEASSFSLVQANAGNTANNSYRFQWVANARL